MLSSVEGHSDFVKSLMIIPSAKLLISGGSDKSIRFWDISSVDHHRLTLIGFVREHTRPVECLTYDPGTTTDHSATIFSADSMGVIKVWNITIEKVDSIRCRATMIAQLGGHSTGINDMWYGLGQLWTASTDCTVVIQDYPLQTPPGRAIPPITLRNPVKAILPMSLTPLNEPLLVAGTGEVLVAYDVSTPDRPELKGGVDAHWHDITGLRMWVRMVKEKSGRSKLEPMVISSSLDGTVRQWTLKEIFSPLDATITSPRPSQSIYHSTLTEEDLDALLAED